MHMTKHTYLGKKQKTAMDLSDSEKDNDKSTKSELELNWTGHFFRKKP